MTSNNGFGGFGGGSGNGGSNGNPPSTPGNGFGGFGSPNTATPAPIAPASGFGTFGTPQTPPPSAAPPSQASGFGTFGTPTPAPVPTAPGMSHTGMTSNTPAGGRGIGRKLATTIQSDSDRILASDGRAVRLATQNSTFEVLKNAGECTIDGVCAFDSGAGESAATRVVIWTTKGGSALQFDQVHAFHQPPPTPNHQGEIDILTDKGVHVRVPPSVGRVVPVEAMFSPKGLILYGDNGKNRAEWADFPMAAEWRPFVKSCHASFDGNTLEYRVELHGLQGALVRRYANAEIERAGEPPEVEIPESHLRIMVWPNNPSPLWKLFVVDVGANNNIQTWNGKFQWSLFHHPSTPHTSGHHRDDDLRVAPCRSIKDDSLILKRSQGLYDPKLPLRVATSDRPHYIEIRSIGEEAVVGTFNLLPRVNPHSEAIVNGSQSESWGADIGTSNSCLARLVTSGTSQRTEIVNFNQVWDPKTPNESLIYCRVGDARAPRSELHWMPGLEGANSVDAFAQEPITQVPTRLALLVKDRRPEALTAQDVRALIPLCDAIVPPLQSGGFGQAKVDDSTVERLKWVERHDDKRVALLEQYITCMLLMAAARLRPSATVTVHFSQPLSFTQRQKEGLEAASRAAAERLTQYTGVPFDAKVDSDESHCILEQFAALRGPVPRRHPIWVLCDIGGGSIDLAVAAGESKQDYAFLAADSIKFGANLVLNNILELAGQQVTASPHPETQRRMVREMILSAGYDAVLAKCNPNTKQQIHRIVQLYFELIAEYVARTVAGCMRNPTRMKALLGDPPENGGFGWDMHDPEFMASRIELLVTGNGFRTFDVLGKSPKAQMRQFASLVRERVAELLKMPTGFPTPAANDDMWFAHVPTPDVSESLGLEPSGGTTFLKEALAYSILASASQVQSGEHREADDYLASPNGITEYMEGWAARREPGNERPWYAFVGASTAIKRSRTGMHPLPVVRTEPWFITDPKVRREEKLFGPPMPGTVLRFAQDLRWNLDFNHLYQQHTAEITSELESSQGQQRQWSLLKVIYEVAIARMFSATSFLH